jgi:hypothetical protein
LQPTLFGVELNINQIDKKALGYRYGRTGTD